MRRIAAAVVAVVGLVLVVVGVLFVVGEATARPESGEELAGFGYLFGGAALAVGLLALVVARLTWQRARITVCLGVAGFVALVLLALLLGTTLAPWLALTAVLLVAATTASRLRRRLRRRPSGARASPAPRLNRPADTSRTATAKPSLRLRC